MILGVDIGGTFTDVVAVDPATGSTMVHKVLTNHQNIVDGLLNGLEGIFTQGGFAAADVSRIIVGTTAATNIVVQRNGARIGLLTTEGFEDVLEIGRLKRNRMYDINIDAQTPVFLAPRRLRAGVPERIAADGSVVTPLDEEAVVDAVERLRQEYAIEAVAVCYLFSFKNPEHERRTGALIKRHFPDLAVSLSSEVNPIHREYERTVVTAFDAYMRPKIEAAMTSMERRLREAGITGEIHVMQSHGGVTTTRNAARRPINLFLSGPAGGGVAGAEIARRAGWNNAVTLDIGGTSCDVAVIDNGAAAIRTEGEIAGYPVLVPMIDITTIGAGGGSLLRVDDTGLLHVGPESAGAWPGPVCYGRGGSEATMTDASLILGYLNPERFAGGAFDLDIASATEAVRRLGARLGLSQEAAALGAHRIMNVQMAEQVRLAMVKRGHDLREFSLVAFGGAGPLHAGAMISMLDMPACIIPLTPGVQSARGLVTADVELELAENFLHQLDLVEPYRLQTTFQQLGERATAQMIEDGIDAGSARVRRAVDLRYVGQIHEITVPIGEEVIDEQALERLAADFRSAYFRMYGHTNSAAIEIVNLRVSLVKPTPPLPDAPQAGAVEHQVLTREAWFLGRNGPTACPVLQRASLSSETTLTGPVIVEQPDTTILVYPEQTARVDSRGNLIITGISPAYAQ